MRTNIYIYIYTTRTGGIGATNISCEYYYERGKVFTCLTPRVGGAW